MNALGKGISVGVLATLWAVTSEAQPEDKGQTYRQNRGHIVFSATKFSMPETEKDFSTMVRKQRKQTTLALGSDGRWTFHFIAFLREAPRADKVNLVWYKLSGKKPELADHMEFVVPAEGVTLRAKAFLTTADFKAGDRLEARITRLIKGREKVYARCRLTLQ